MTAARTDFSLFGGAERLPPSFTAASTSATASSASSSDEDELTGLDTPSVGSHSPSQASIRRIRSPGEEWAPRVVDPKQDPNDWLWLMTEEPHRSRRKAILKAHPEIKKLMGHEPRTKWVVLFVTLVQFTTAYLLRHTHPFSPLFLAVAYAIGGTANQNTFLAIHEITHNLAFKGVKANRVFAILANLPIGVPFAMMFKKYHIEHHKFLAEDGIDTDMPSKLELIVLRNVFGKAFFASVFFVVAEVPIATDLLSRHGPYSTFQIFFYALRPGFIRYQAPTRWIALNMLTQLAFNTLLVKCLGWSALMYLILSSFMAGSLHPCAGHFIAEHYLFDGHDQETWSYYGPLNILAYNVGYHNEHHDFPSVPWTRLPALHDMAKEFYDPLPSHPSWPGVTWRFIFDSDIGMWSRVKRNPRRGIKADEGGGDDKGIAGGLKDE